VVDLRVGLFHRTAAGEGNRAYAALRAEPPGRLLELPVHLADRQEASVYLYYAMQAPRERPGGYSTTAPLKADAQLRQLREHPCRSLGELGVRYVTTHAVTNPCGGRLLGRDGPISAYAVGR
jgi:hypothetical protein